MNKPLLFIFLTIFIDVTGLGIIIPVLPDLIRELTHSDLSTASKYAGWIAASFSVMMFICSPIMGGLSDRYGRRPVLLLSLLGFGLDYILQGLAQTIVWLFIGRLIAGMFGASYSTAAAYIADVSSADKKAQNFGLIGAAFGLGFILGPALGAVLGQYGLRIPFFGSAFLALLNLIFGFFVLPESLKLENRRAFDWKRANPVGTLKVLFRYPALSGFVIILFLTYVAHYSLQSTWSFYTMKKFSWDHTMVGYSLAFVGLMMAIVQGGLTRVIIPKLGNRRSIYTGMCFAIFGYLAYAFAPTSLSMFIIIIPFAMSGLASPAIQAIITNQVPANAQGELQGGLGSLLSLTAIVGPLLMTQVFNFFTRDQSPVYFPGAPFLLAFVLVSTATMLLVKPLSKLS
ncbi:MAG: TCR/Tet family MFS transporter [Bacteroidota bacterium]|nr:TCR/Tet family MFS transporter [Bacteroidota bacterium]